MFLWKKKSRIAIPCAKAIPPFLKKEILDLELPVLSVGPAGIETEGTMADAMRLNLFIRTGQRILFLLESFQAKDPDRLYRKISGIEWENILHEDGYLCVTSFVDNPTINDSRFANLKCKDAIVDRMQKKCGRRPDSGPLNDQAVNHLYWVGN
jgi:23S rRNA G2445 N2-methylase RlmL